MRMLRLCTNACAEAARAPCDVLVPEITAPLDLPVCTNRVRRKGKALNVTEVIVQTLGYELLGVRIRRGENIAHMLEEEAARLQK